MANRTVEERLTELEADRGEWRAALRVRVKGFSKLEDRAVELSKSTREYWRLKAELLDLLLFSLQPLLGLMFADGSMQKIRKELSECFGQADALLGVFPVGGKFGEHKALDIRFKPGLTGWRTNSLVKYVLTPELKKRDAGGVEMWVLLSQPEMARRYKRRAESQRGNSRNQRQRA